MSDLPKYSRSGFDTTETDSLVKGSGRESFDGPGIAAYPPRAESSTNGLSNITYSFIPQYPVKGKRQNVLGVLGRNTEETIDIIRRAFPQLKEYADERIVLEVGVEGQKDDQWSGFMEESWARFATQPPTRMKVTVADAPGDARRRMMREIGMVACAILGPIAAFGLFITLCVLIGASFDDDIVDRGKM